MRFEFYQECLADVPKLSVGGTVDNAFYLSHREGNATPPSLRADTSTEIAQNFVATPASGVLSVSRLTPDAVASELRAVLIQ